MSKPSTIREEVRALGLIVNDLKDQVLNLNKITITVSNGKEKHITYRRSEFFQMLYDRKNVWKDKVRITAKDILLFGGILSLLMHEIFGIF